MTPARRMDFSLAIRLGFANPDAMLEEMPHRIYDEWIDYYQLDPWSEERQDWRMAMLAAVMSNLWRDRKAGVAKIEDFMPRFEPREPPTADGLLEKLRTFTLAMGGTVIDNRKGKHASNNPGSQTISTSNS